MAPLNITVKNTSGRKFAMEVDDLSETVAAFKERLSEVSSIPADAQRLIYRGRILNDQLTFNDLQQKHGLESGNSMHVVASSSAARSSTTSSSANSNTSSSSPTSANTASNGGNRDAAANATRNGNTPGTGSGNGNAPSQTPMPNPFGTGLGDGFGAGAGAGAFGGLPNMQEMQAQLMQNPEQVQAMLNNPVMESLMNNPEVMRSFVMANPQMRQLMDNNPEVAHVFNDPATFRQMMQMARNPSLMQEVMRNTDRQMANIEMMPGGFDALRRMHENIQTPLYEGFANAINPTNENTNGDTNTNANANTHANSTNSNDNPFASLFQQNTPSNTPMPNPWARDNREPGVGTPSFGDFNNRPSATQNSGPNNGNPFASLFQNRTTGNNIPGMNGGTGTGMGENARGTEPDAGAGLNGDSMMQLLENPAMQQMMQQMFADPTMLRTIMESSPQMRALMQTQPQLATMLQNPELLRTLLNPDVMRAARQLHDAMGRSGASLEQMAGLRAGVGADAGGGVGTGARPAPTDPGNTNTANTQRTAGTGTGFGDGNGSLDVWATMLQEIEAARARDGGIGGGFGQEPEPTREQLLEMYRTQLGQLRDMGFLDEGMCLQALRQSRGNVSLAIENLLNRFGS